SWDPARYRPNDSQYIRDVWMKESMRAMGHPSTYSTFVHLYVNGLYWGLFNPAERIDASQIALHLGGDEEDYDVMADFNELGDGSRTFWDEMFTHARGGLTSNEDYEQMKAYLDVENFADYMLLHFFAGAEDWPHHNGYAVRN